MKKSSESAEGQSVRVWVHTNKKPKWGRKELVVHHRAKAKKTSTPSSLSASQRPALSVPVLVKKYKKKHQTNALTRGEPRAQRILIAVLYSMWIESLCDSCTIDRQVANIWTERKVQWLGRLPKHFVLQGCGEVTSADWRVKGHYVLNNCFFSWFLMEKSNMWWL